MISTTFITDKKGRKISAVVPIKKYLQLLKELEELEDIKAYDKARAKNQKPIPLRDAIEQRRSSRRKPKA